MKRMVLVVVVLVGASAAAYLLTVHEGQATQALVEVHARDGAVSPVTPLEAPPAEASHPAPATDSRPNRIESQAQLQAVNDPLLSTAQLLISMIRTFLYHFSSPHSRPSPRRRQRFPPGSLRQGPALDRRNCSQIGSSPTRGRTLARASTGAKALEDMDQRSEGDCLACQVPGPEHALQANSRLASRRRCRASSRAARRLSGTSAPVPK